MSDLKKTAQYLALADIPDLIARGKIIDLDAAAAKTHEKALRLATETDLAVAGRLPQPPRKDPYAKKSAAKASANPGAKNPAPK